MEGISVSNSATQKSNPFTDRRKRIGLTWNDGVQWRLKNDVKRVLLYKTGGNGGSIGATYMLTPSEAIIIALFDGKRTIAEVMAIAADVFGESQEKAESTVATILRKWSIALEEKTDQSITPRYDPKTFAIPAWEVDRKTKRLFKPSSLLFRVSDSCMRNCIYCNVETRPAETMNLLPLERWEQLAQEVKDLDIYSIILSGGDPFMHKDIIDIIHCFTKRGIHPTVTTKSFISVKKAKKLKEIGLKEMQVSIDAPVASVADFLTQSPGYFDQVIKTIKNLQGERIGVYTNSVVTSYNLLLIPQLVRMLSDMGIKRIRLTQYVRTLFNRHDDSCFLSGDSVEWLNNQLERVKEELPGIKVNFDSSPDYATATDIEKKKEAFKKRAGCSGGISGCVVSGDGRVIPCDEIPLTEENVMGDVRTQSIREVWESRKFARFAAPPRDFFSGTACHECTDFDECHQGKGRCFRDALKAYGSLFAPAPVCWKAPKGKRIC